jgi:hypothetical protein
MEAIMQPTRIDTKTLAIATAEALQYIEQALAALAPYTPILTPEERRSMLRPGEGFPSAAKALCRASREHAMLSAVVSFEPEAVQEDLDNLEILAPLLERLAELSQRVSDSRLVWLSEAYVPCLALYSAAKSIAKQNGALRNVISPIAQIFSGRARTEEPVTEEK